MVEKVGKKLEDVLVVRNPWRKRKCMREECLMCEGGGEKEWGKKAWFIEWNVSLVNRKEIKQDTMEKVQEMGPSEAENMLGEENREEKRTLCGGMTLRSMKVRKLCTE